MNKQTEQTEHTTHTPECMMCGAEYEFARWKIGKKTCLPCGDDVAKNVKHTIAPLNKSNYMVFTDITLLKQLNPKRTA